MSPRRLIPLAAVACAAITAPAGAAPLVLTEQTGIVRQIVRGSQWAAWVRCPAPTAPAEIWARQIGGAKTVVQIPTAKPLADCDSQRLFGISGSTLIARTASPSEPARAVAIRIPDGAEINVLDREVADATDARLVAGDTYGPFVAWVRDSTQGQDRVSEVLTWSLSDPTKPPEVVRRQSHTGGGRITGVWRGGSGEVMWRQAIPSGVYAAYSTGEETLIRRRADGTLQTISRVTGPIHIAHADLDRDYAVYSLVRDDSNAAYIYARDLVRDQKRLLRIGRSAVRPLIRLGADMPAPKVYGSLVAWRERERLANKTFVDTARRANLATQTSGVSLSLPDRRDQRIFQSAPDVYGKFATWAVVRYAGPTGWAGGYSGVATQPATSQIVVTAIG